MSTQMVWTRQGMRLAPAGPFTAYKTYRIFAPPSTHWAPATCAEVGCGPYTGGWRTIVDETTDQGRAQAFYIRRRSGRRFTEDRDDAGLTVFAFEPGQRCFAADRHRRRLDRPPLYLVEDGDWRRKTGRRRHAGVMDWVDDFANHQDRIAAAVQRG